MKYTATAPKILGIRVAFSPSIGVVTPESAAFASVSSHRADAPVGTQAQTHGARGRRVQHPGAHGPPSRHDGRFGEAPAIAVPRRYDGDFRRNGVDKRRAGRREAAMVRHYDRFNTVPLSAFEDLTFGIGLNVPGEQQAVPPHLNQHDAGRIITAPRGIGIGMQNTKSDLISLPVLPRQTRRRRKP